jgi:hypothetical protein
MAPVLTRLFTRCSVLLLAFGHDGVDKRINVKREVLIGFDLLLVLVVGLVLCAPPHATRRRRPASSTACNCCSWSALVSVWCARGIAARISRLASLPTGGVMARISFFSSTWRGRPALYVLPASPGLVAVLERWQIAYLPVYSIWAALVVIMFPPVFGYRWYTLAGTAPADSLTSRHNLAIAGSAAS